MFGQYYNESVRKLVVAFGNLFNEVYIAKTKDDNSTTRLRIPLTYSPKEKFYRRIREPGTITENTRVQIDLPRLCFSIKTVEYDTARKLNKINERRVRDPSDNKIYTVNKIVPYNFVFELTSFCRSIDENLQIMEQILPNFAPELVQTINFNKSYESVNVPFILDAMTQFEDTEGSFEERRLLLNTYTITAKSYVFGPVEETPNVIQSFAFTIDNLTVTGGNINITIQE
jgi:hypothetical protein